MKIEYIKEFCLLAEQKNYTATAKEIFITQSTLSRHIVSMEEEMGAKLLFRNTQYVELTPIGETVFKSFRKLISEYDNTLKKINDMKANIDGKITVGMLYYALKEYAYPAINAMTEHYPGIKLEPISYQPHPLILDILGHKVDIGMVMSFPFEREKELKIIHVGSEKLCVMMPRAMANEEESISVRDLIEINVVFSTADPELTEFVKGILKNYNINEDKYLYADHVDMLVFKCVQNHGISIVPGHIRNIGNTEVSFLNIMEDEFKFDVGWAYRNDNNNPAIPLFVDALNSC